MAESLKAQRERLAAGFLDDAGLPKDAAVLEYWLIGLRELQRAAMFRLRAEMWPAVDVDARDHEDWDRLLDEDPRDAGEGR